jgi:predicted dehydrogenase
MHAEISIAALEAGKHVLCEKPMATTRAQAAEMIETADRSGRKLMIAHHMRFESGVRQLRQSLEQFPLGDVYYCRAQWLRRRRLPARPGFTVRSQSGGGSLYDLGVHMLDLGLWMMGHPQVVSVSGATFDWLARRRDDIGSEWGQWDPTTIDVEDFAVGMVRFANGSVLNLEASWLGFQPEDEFWRLQLFGTQAGVVWPPTQISGETRGKPWDIRPTEPAKDKPHHEEIRQFARAILDDVEVPVPPRQTGNNIAILEGLYRSALEGREVPVEGFDAAPPKPVAGSAETNGSTKGATNGAADSAANGVANSVATHAAIPVR